MGLQQLIEGNGGKKEDVRSSAVILLEKLIILLIQANGILTPELLWLVHWTPFQAARLEFRTVLVKWAVEFRKKSQGVVKEIQRTQRLYTSQLHQSGNMSRQKHSASTRVISHLICMSCICQVNQTDTSSEYLRSCTLSPSLSSRNLMSSVMSSSSYFCCSRFSSCFSTLHWIMAKAYSCRVSLSAAFSRRFWDRWQEEK